MPATTPNPAELAEEIARQAERYARTFAEFVLAMRLSGSDQTGSAQAADRARNELHAAIDQLRDLASGPSAGAVPPSIEAAHEMGAKGAPATESERLAFESWMRGHCWALSCTWRGTEYRSDEEDAGGFSPLAAGTRRLWAAWRDRAALAAPAATPPEEKGALVPLTPEQIAEACGWAAGKGCKPLPMELRIARAIEAAHGIK